MKQESLSPYMFAAEFPENSIFSQETYVASCVPGYRPIVPEDWLLDGVLVLTYWHAIRLYKNLLTVLIINQNGDSEENKQVVIDACHFRNRRLEDAVKFLLAAYPPYVAGSVGFPKPLEFRMVRLRTSECPHLIGKDLDSLEIS